MTFFVVLAGGAHAIPDASAFSTASALNFTVSGFQTLDGNECNPSKACNVCTSCCKEYIPDGAACDKCVKDECPKKTECNPSKTCNVCAACCKEYIPDGDACDKCVKDECSVNCTAFASRSACGGSGACDWCAVSPWGETSGICYDNTTFTCCGSDGQDCGVHDVQFCRINVTQCCASGYGCAYAARPTCVAMNETCCTSRHEAFGCGTATQQCCKSANYASCCSKEEQCCSDSGGGDSPWCCPAKESCGSTYGACTKFTSTAWIW